MKNTNTLHKNVIKKIFGSAKHQLYTTLFATLSEVAAEKDYLENLTTHADAIHWHLNRVDIIDFENILQRYFAEQTKQLRKEVAWQKITIAFDETFIPFYGNATDNWVVGYTNKIKGAKGSYKFMVCSIIAQEKRYVLGIMPMHNCQDTNTTVEQMIQRIKAQFSVETVLFDRGFCNKILCRELESQNLRYLILCPKWTNIKRYLQEKRDEVVEKTIINEKKTKNKFNWRFVFAYNRYGYDWTFATNLQETPANLVKLYKCRWGIETNFRVMDLADIKSKSKNIVIRCFFFLISAVLFNLWLQFDYDITFEAYLDNLTLAQTSLCDIIEKWRAAKELFNVKISAEEQKIYSSFVTYAKISLQLPRGEPAKISLHESADFVISIQGISEVVV